MSKRRIHYGVEDGASRRALVRAAAIGILCAASLCAVAPHSYFSAASPARAAAPEKPVTAEPDVYILSPRGLAQTRARAAADPALAPALARLRADADKAMKAGPFSVTHKKSLPPSGDRHDYMSVGPYWWPDPTKPDSLPYIRRDGEVNPERSTGDTDASELGKMVSAVNSLALGYYLLGEERYAARAATLLRAWFLDAETRMNPNLKYGQAIPGRVEGRGIGLIDTREFATMLDNVTLLDGSSSWTKDDRMRLAAWFGEFVTWMRESPIGKDEADEHNNHGTYYDIQVARYALFVGKPEIARDVLEKSRARRIATQIAPDGKQPHELARTKAFTYSTMNLQGFFDLAAMGERLGVDIWRWKPEKGGDLRAATDFLMTYADPTNKWPYPQIEAKGVDYLKTLAPVLRRAALAYGDDKYEKALSRLPFKDLDEQRFQLLYPK